MWHWTALGAILSISLISCLRASAYIMDPLVPRSIAWSQILNVVWFTSISFRHRSLFQHHRKQSQQSQSETSKHGRLSALQGQLISLALPPVCTSSHCILASFSWMYLRSHLEVVESATQIWHPIHHRDFLSVNQKRLYRFIEEHIR